MPEIARASALSAAAPVTTIDPDDRTVAPLDVMVPAPGVDRAPRNGQRAGVERAAEQPPGDPPVKAALPVTFTAPASATVKPPVPETVSELVVSVATFLTASDPDDRAVAPLDVRVPMLGVDAAARNGERAGGERAAEQSRTARQ